MLGDPSYSMCANRHAADAVPRFRKPIGTSGTAGSGWQVDHATSHAVPSPRCARGRIARRSDGSGRLLRPAAQFPADDGGDPRAEQFDRAHNLGMRRRPHAQLQQEALVPEDRVLEKDFLRDHLRAADDPSAL
jgi:hypothetical protein